ncbi:MAG TPA: TraB/GumN family protein [Candidatus Thermoplasmatota archaeon]|nr:TraB/GumN family protein [Candidatus Thermoplasmatota archaeon]
MLEEIAPGIVVVGTAHVSAQSVAEVESVLRTRRPARVLVELDARRLAALQDPEAWQRTDLFKILREKKQHLFLLQLYLAAEQARIGRSMGVAPGSEMLRAVEVAGEVGAEVVLIDRDVAVTLKRGFAAMGFWSRLRLFWKVWVDVLTPAAKDAEQVDVEALLKTDAITRMTDEFARFAPDIKVALIDERDAYMASHIAEQSRLAGSAGVVAVVGAGHLPGIRQRFADESAATVVRAPLEAPPPARLTVGKVLGWALPLGFVAAFVWLGWKGVQHGNLEGLGAAVLSFILITGIFSAIGCALALGHPLSILVAFVAAPFGVLHPLIATGWFAALAEAKLRTPTVADFQAVKRIETFGQFWRNGVVRVLLVAALTNVGAMVGGFLAGAKVLRQLGVTG